MKILEELFRFAEGDLIFTQTSAAYSIVYNTETYDPHPISRTQAESKNELTKASINVITSFDNPIALRYLSTPVDSVVTLTIFQKIVDEAVYVFWKGRLSSVKASSREITLTFESFFTSLRRPGLRARYQKSCRHALYGRGCTLDSEDWKFETYVTDVQQNLVTVGSVNGAPDNKYRGGMIRGPDGTVRFVVSQIGNQLSLSRPFFALEEAFNLQNFGYGENYGGLYGGLATPIYPGCAHNPEACQEFDNFDNYGGFPWIPGKNPFGGSNIT